MKHDDDDESPLSIIFKHDINADKKHKDAIRDVLVWYTDMKKEESKSFSMKNQTDSVNPYYYSDSWNQLWTMRPGVYEEYHDMQIPIELVDQTGACSATESYLHSLVIDTSSNSEELDINLSSSSESDGDSNLDTNLNTKSSSRLTIKLKRVASVFSLRGGNQSAPVSPRIKISPRERLSKLRKVASERFLGRHA